MLQSSNKSSQPAPLNDGQITGALSYLLGRIGELETEFGALCSQLTPIVHSPAEGMNAVMPDSVRPMTRFESDIQAISDRVNLLVHGVAITRLNLAL